ncbi:MAG: antibiotic biosynthesis monooxygenase, partial [Porticoccaceae bacterium]|nr:antibiotic biosynthesis monooxygenase [Porticoccaceae bacterium]
MAIGVIATITVRDGKNAEFEELFTGLTEQVLANEPGATFYALHRTKSDSQVYKVLEQYASKEAL